jgi:hypothetical protein
MHDNHRETHQVVQIDISNRARVRRFRCPNGHTTWEPTNGGLWCRSCSRDAECDDPHHYELVDVRDDEPVAWDRVELTGQERVKTAV